MTPALVAAAVALSLAFPHLTTPQMAEPMQTPPHLAHVSNSFQFQLSSPLARVAPLFGPEGERCWAGQHWDPQFIHPQPAADVQGAVFTVQHGPHTSLWINTVFDLAAGRMQYVSVIPGRLISLIDVRLTPVGAARTAVEVTYARTALAPAASDDVTAMGTSDHDSGPHWQQAIEACLTTNPSRRP
jgi:hypothetical protein